jgi:hypothetical protein
LNDDGTPPDEKVDDDWLYRWRDYTGSVSNEELQRLWGKLLSGEVKEPGTYSLRCLDFMRNLTQSDAKLIELLSGLLIQKFVWRPESRDDTYPLSLDQLLDLQNLGVISGVDSTGLHIQFGNSSLAGHEYVRVLTSHERCIIIRHENKDSILNFGAYPVTKLGLQLISLGEFKANVGYLTSFSRSIVSKGYKVSLAYPVPSQDGYTRWRDAVEII